MSESEQLDDILIEKNKVFVIKIRYKLGFSLFCAGLLAFGTFLVPFVILDQQQLSQEDMLLIATPIFFAIAGYIYFFDMLKKQKQVSVRT